MSKPRPERVRLDISAKASLAGFWNGWFYKWEIDKARAFAGDHSEDECRAELARLDKVRDGRIQQWRYSQ